MNDNSGRVLGIDYGSVRIGVAMSDPLRIIAQGYGTFQNTPQVADKISALVREHEIQLIVVGLPLNLKGVKGAKAQEVDRFIESLKKKISVEIVQYDERFTSVIAQQTILALGTTKKKRMTHKGKVDELASAIMLQSFLDQSKPSMSC